MLNTTEILINGKKYIVEIGLRAQQGSSIGYNADFYKGSEFVGSADILVSDSLLKSWAKGKYTERNENWLKNLLVITLPHLPITCDENQLKNDDKLFNFCILFVGNGTEIQGNTIYIHAEWEAEKQVEQLIYNDNIEDERVEFEILNYLNNYSIHNNYQPMGVSDLVQALYIDPKIAERALGYFYNNQEATINEYKGSIMSGQITISTKGINKLRELRKERNRQPNLSQVVYNQNGGIAIYGSNNTIGTINQNSIQTINELDNLIKFLDLSDINSNDKQNAIMDAETIKTQLAKPNPSKTIIKEAWTSLGALATIEGVIGFINRIQPLIHHFIK